MRLTTSTLALALLSPLPALAQDAPPPPAPTMESTGTPSTTTEMPAPGATAPAAMTASSVASAIKWEGLIDTFYMLNLNAADSDKRTAPGLRNFDLASNSFSLNYMKLGAQYDSDLAGFRVDFGYGHTGVVLNANSALTSEKGAGAVLYGNGFVVQQAFATMKLGAVTVDAGKFVTTAGAEVIESNKNWLYSRSLLFYGIPLVHTGVRVNFKPAETVAVQLTATNGWNNDPDVSGEKTFGANVVVTPTSATTVAATTYFGKEGSGGDSRLVFDLVLAQTISDKLAVNLNFDYFKEGDPTWYGASLMGKFGLGETLYLAARGEYLMGKDGGFVGGADDTSVYEGTVMLGIPWGSNLEARIEARGDFSDKEIFMTGDGMEAKKSQITATAALLAYF